MSEIVLVRVSGRDRPGITHQLAATMSAHRARILDVGQATVHSSLALGILVQLPEGADASAVIKDVLFAGHEMGLHVDFEPVSEQDYVQWVEREGKPRHIVTTLGRAIEAEHLSEVSRILHEHRLNVAVITRLSGRQPLDKSEVPRASIEWSVRGVTDRHALRRDLFLVAQRLGIDVAVQVDDVFRRNRRLVCFDMDSTLIQAECIDELAAEAGVGDRVAAVTEAAMNGELNFNESLERRLALLRGLPEEALSRVAQRLPLTDGARRVFGALRSLGYKTAILSGGFTYFARRLQEQLGVDYMFANELELEQGKLTGRVVGDIVDGARKAALLEELARRESISPQQVVAVGDGANDLPMLAASGLGIAFHAKPTVRASADHSISSSGLDGILYLMGFRDRDLERLSR